MEKVLEGVRVLEVAQWWFVPSAGGVLADWGADVIKVEHPVTGDPQRGLITSGLVPQGGFNFMWEQPNRGKRSVGIDLGTPGGRELLYKLAEKSDVFLTSFLPEARRRLEIDLEHVRARNPRIIYARGTGQGPKGPDAEKGGYDGASFWARGGLAEAFSYSVKSETPVGQRPAFGDGIGGMTIAGGIAAALFKRERTGEPSTVDISLLSTACWVLSPDITAAPFIPRFPTGGDRRQMPNPLVGQYKTKDDRWIMIIMLQPDRFWADFCRHLGREDLIDDPRFADAKVRFENRGECVDALDETFASRTLDEWRERLETMEGVWAPMQTPREIHDDRQVVANGYLPAVTGHDGKEFRLAGSPVQFEEQAQELGPAPEHGQHTEEVLMDVLGLSWDEISGHKERKAIL
ncbi:MAG: CoA transferase [Myxococcota bacterium]|nr:CoA transferase [Myxococcota bacterium]